MSEKELTQEELERATGGKRKMQTTHGLGDAGSTAGGDNKVEINDVDALDDSPTRAER